MAGKGVGLFRVISDHPSVCFCQGDGRTNFQVAKSDGVC